MAEWHLRDYQVQRSMSFEPTLSLDQFCNNQLWVNNLLCQMLVMDRNSRLKEEFFSDVEVG